MKEKNIASIAFILKMPNSTINPPPEILLQKSIALL